MTYLITNPKKLFFLVAFYYSYFMNFYRKMHLYILYVANLIIILYISERRTYGASRVIERDEAIKKGCIF